MPTDEAVDSSSDSLSIINIFSVENEQMLLERYASSSLGHMISSLGVCARHLGHFEIRLVCDANGKEPARFYTALVQRACIVHGISARDAQAIELAQQVAKVENLARKFDVVEFTLGKFLSNASPDMTHVAMATVVLCCSLTSEIVLQPPFAFEPFQHRLRQVAHRIHTAPQFLEPIFKHASQFGNTCPKEGPKSRDPGSFRPSAMTLFSVASATIYPTLTISLLSILGNCWPVSCRCSV